MAIGVQGRVRDRLQPRKRAARGIWRQVGFLQGTANSGGGGRGWARRSEGGEGQEGVGGGGTSTPAGTCFVRRNSRVHIVK